LGQRPDGLVGVFVERFVDRWESVSLLGQKRGRGPSVVEPGGIETRILAAAIKMVGKFGFETKLKGFLLVGTVMKTFGVLGGWGFGLAGRGWGFSSHGKGAKMEKGRMAIGEDLEGLPGQRDLNLKVLVDKEVVDEVLLELVLADHGRHDRWRFESGSRKVLDAVKATIGSLKAFKDGADGVRRDAGRQTLREELFKERKDEIRFPSGGKVWRPSIFSICRLAGKESREAVRGLELLGRATEEVEGRVGIIAQIDVEQAKDDHGVRSGRPSLFVHLERGAREEVEERAE
jgi:hypothetical protein